ncbi:hypothetical protein ABIB00_001832 [Bradyrhizobium sp. LB14.3]|uniref:hypothetical protein n=1 Tax=Bradyrhizobium sp. LB14.3 TaxID=3156328 RepID=UPI0033908E8D
MLISFNGSKPVKVAELGFEVVCLLRFGHHGRKKRCFSLYLSDNFSGLFPGEAAPIVEHGDSQLSHSDCERAPELGQRQLKPIPNYAV